MINLLNCDCLEYMKDVPDKFFDLAIVDPPFNVGASDGTFGNKGKYTRKDLKHYANHDKTPDKEYFDELFRISKDQIIWGMNYYPQFLSHSGAIIWDKNLTGSPMSECEIAFQSKSKLVRKVKCEWNGFLKNEADGVSRERIHPNQKPVPLYRFLLENYANDGDKIFDSHGGSMSIAIACHDMKFDLTLCEIDKDYYDAGVKRFENHKRQLAIF